MDSFEDHYRLGMQLPVVGRPLEAAASLARAAALRPDHVDTHIALAHALMLAGDWPRAYEEMEWRWRLPGRERPTPAPWWDGRIEPGKALLLLREEGLGDVIQYAGFAPQIAAAGMRVMLWPHAELVELLGTLRGVEIVPPGTSLQGIDYVLPVRSLGRVLGITPQTLKRPASYLSADPKRVDAWRDRLGDRRGRLRIGVAWSGRPTQVNNSLRSIPPETLASIAALPNVELHSLHNSVEARDAIARAPFPIVDHAAQPLGFVETAALMANLDMVISVCTSLAHLAGALGRRTWILLAHPPDGRWLLKRRDTPWYPTATLFRQPRPGDWESVIREVVREVQSLRSF
jgi:hypothetical protein